MVATTSYFLDICKKFRNTINFSHEIESQKVHVYTCLSSRLEELVNHTLVFNVEETLLKSSSWFPFFMLVAFEGGGLLRAFLLLILYPLICLVDEEWKLNIMVFVCFVGVKRSALKSVGRTVLPKFFLEDVGYQGFELLTRFRKRVGVTNFPRVMVEAFLQEYLGINTIVGREIKVYRGYYLGLMERKKDEIKEITSLVCKGENVIVISGCEKTLKDQQLITNCKGFYLVRKVDKENWNYLPRDKYPKPLIFHDGRLAFFPTPMASLTMLIWLPFGVILCITRIITSIFLPFKISLPILAFLGTSGLTSKNCSNSQTILNSSTNQNRNSKGKIYVCNHKTLLDPIYISYACKVPLTALAYSISKLSQVLTPIKTVILTRDKEKDAKVMQKMLSKGSVVVCPEGTTCRERYLLRFSPLFAEMTDDIVPVALEVKVNMFYGTTASGIKALDPIFFLLNPYPYYYVNILENVPKSHTCGSGGWSNIDVANYVQAEIAKSLGYTCTLLTRKDKYMMLAGNTGD
ncbi:probable glycerol-3-phosphate acyltransferase 3 [Chenopodium quinoa]|nr:probable glycerol-3-phosphate acyltransferase 3 [Chenopodium quinoa]